jgi:hypothetical protein
MVSNFTLVGADDGSANHGMRLRHGTKGKLWNGLITGFAQGIRVGTECDAYVNDGSALREEQRHLEQHHQLQQCRYHRDECQRYGNTTTSALA